MLTTVFLVPVIFLCLKYANNFFHQFDNKYNHQDVHYIPKSRSLPPPPKPNYAQCKLLSDAQKYDCFPEDGANKDACEARGCCWIPRQNKKSLHVNLDVPYCFYPPNYTSYTYINVTETAYGLCAFLRRAYKSPYPGDIEVIKMDVRFETSTRLHVKV